MKLYTLVIGGVEHTVQLDEDEAKRYGSAVTEVKAAQSPANKGRTAKNKES